MRIALILVSGTLLTVLSLSPFPISQRKSRNRIPLTTIPASWRDRSARPSRRRCSTPIRSTFGIDSLRPSPSAPACSLPARGGPPVARIEGGDRIEFFGWGGTTYWDEPANVAQLDGLLDQFLGSRRRKALDRSSQTGAAPTRPVDLVRFSDDRSHRQPWRFRDPSPPRRACAANWPARFRRWRCRPKRWPSFPTIMPWRFNPGGLPRRTTLIRSAITCRRTSCPTPTSGKNWTSTRRIVRKMSNDAMCSCTCGPSRGVLTSASFVVSPRGGRSWKTTCETLDAKGIDWRASAQHGSISLKPDAPELPAGTEVALLQFLIALDTNLQLVPTSLVESVRLLIFKNTNGIAGSRAPTWGTA